jgi:hypothetical protein
MFHQAPQKWKHAQLTITTNDCVVWFFEYLEEPKFTYFKNQRTVSSGSLKKQSESKEWKQVLVISKTLKDSMMIILYGMFFLFCFLILFWRAVVIYQNWFFE